MIRKCKNSKSGWNSGDLDVAFQLFSCGMVWDGNLVSKDSRDHFLRHGYAVKREGMQALTGKGTLAFLSSRAVWASAWRRWRLHRRNPFMADAAQVARAVK